MPKISSKISSKNTNNFRASTSKAFKRPNFQSIRSRLVRLAKRQRSKLILSLGFMIALPIIALGIFFNASNTQEFRASASDPATEVKADNFDTIIDDDGVVQINPTEHFNGKFSSYCSGLNKEYISDYYDLNNVYKQDTPVTPNTDTITHCKIFGLKGHDS